MSLMYGDKQKTQGISLSRKLQLLILAVSISVIAVVSSINLWIDANAFRNDLLGETITLSEVVVTHSQAALDFGDRKTAARLIQSLQVVPDIRHALLYDDDGLLFAEFIDNGHDHKRVLEEIDDHWLKESSSSDLVQYQFTDNFLFIVVPSIKDGERLGYLHIMASLSGFNQQILYAVTVALLLLIVISLLAYFVAIRFQRKFLRGPSSIFPR